ncbi:hypothetical protein GALMADRAFT_244607 [Galerina marginata CBS 339.88]|uniref:SH3 domain-containing protein n=1 Tax=Galerina marginata (strain CBS 339.88) TaxID=685588 RepID=A0A067T724_GALM3|nr:hypothetical protein GALMADRAFT_244607 [Galerina marginata CBS 339.88]
MSANQVIDHLISQTRENVSFLCSIQRLSSEDANFILAKLPSPTASKALNTNATFPTPSSGFDKPNENPPSRSPVSVLTARPPPPIPSPALFRVRALWGYNEDGKELNDLSFAQGDIIEVIDEKNVDWWSGRLSGREALFPSSYVERLPREVLPKPTPNFRNTPYSEKPPGPPNFPNGPPYSSPYPYPQQNTYYAPPGPPPNGPYPPYQMGPPPPQVVQPPPNVVVTAEQNGGKKHGFFNGSFGNTLAQSAVGGVGFGAGSAVGSGIVNSIF